MDKKSVLFKETPSFLIVRRWVYSRLMGLAGDRSPRRYIGDNGVTIHETGPTACLPGRAYSFDHRKLYKRCSFFDMSPDTVRQAAEAIGVFRSTGYWGCRPEIGDCQKMIVWDWVCYLSPYDVNFPTVFPGRANGEKGIIAREILLKNFVVKDKVCEIDSGTFKIACLEAEQKGVSSSLFKKIAVNLGFKGRQGCELRLIDGAERFLDVVDQMKRFILEKVVLHKNQLEKNGNSFGLFTALDWLGIDSENIDALIVDAALAELVYEDALSCSLRYIGEEKVDVYAPTYKEPLNLNKVKSLYLNKLATKVCL